jgi:uncharacterized protein (TIGR00369 family)
MNIMPSAVTTDKLEAFFLKAFPIDTKTEREFVLVERGRVIIRMESSPELIRLGGMFSGPTQMSLADLAAYAAVFTRFGITPMAVTSSLNINFLRPCIGSAIEVDACIIKCGKSSVVMEAKIKAVGVDKIASQAMISYVIPHLKAANV